jgi:hypothetical protein
MNPEKPHFLPNSQRPTPERGQRYEIFKSPEERSLLLLIVDNFINQIRIIHQKNPYDAFVFFDRGARIFSHLIRERWKHRFPEDKIPNMFFVKIGREMGLHSSGPNQSVEYIYPWKNIFARDCDDRLPSVGMIIKRVKDNLWFKKLVGNLRKAFTKRGKALFDAKRVLLVDEFIAFGATLLYGKELFQRAFKDINVDGAGLVAMFMEYNPNPSIINPTSIDFFPRTSGVRSSPPSEEYKDRFFIEPIYLTSIRKRILELENEIEKVEEKVKKISEHKRVKKERSWGIDFIVHPLVEKKLEKLKKNLENEIKRYSETEGKWKRYRQARQEIHSIATSD